MIEKMIVLYDWVKLTDKILTNDGEITFLEYFMREERRILKSDDRIVKAEIQGPMIRMLVNDVAEEF